MTRDLFVLDPGARKCGVALFQHGGLVAAATLQATNDEMLPHLLILWVRDHGASETVKAVVEEPVSYRYKRSAHKDIARLQALIDALPYEFTRYTPHAWKGNTPKTIHHKRVQEKMGYPLFWWRDLGHDARDAVCLGLYHLGETGKGGI